MARKIKDITGQKFNYLTAVSYNSTTSKERGRTYWDFKCDCGNIKTIIPQSTKRGLTKSCGCKVTYKPRPKKDIAGMKFNCWTAIDIDEEMSKEKKKICWNFVCDCGTKRAIIGTLISNNKLKSCGCKNNNKRRDLTGQKFNRFTAIDVNEGLTKEKGFVYWNVVCDCGTKKAIRSSAIVGGRIKSCGCWNAEVLVRRATKPPGVGAFNSWLYGYKNGAKVRGLEWSLTRDEFKEITSQNCHYCNKEPRPYKTVRNTSYAFVNGIDRVDSSIGYRLDNTVPCCKRCNWMKSDMGAKEFLEHIEGIYRHAIYKRD